MTAAVLGPQQEALVKVLASAASRVENLERYAQSVSAVDEARRDFIGAQEAELLNDSVRDLLAETAKDQLAVTELASLATKAAVAEQAFRRTIEEANLAAEILAFPALMANRPAG